MEVMKCFVGRSAIVENGYFSSKGGCMNGP